MTAGSSAQFSVVSSGSNVYTVMSNNTVAISGSAATLNLQSGTVNTVVIVRNALTENYELVNVGSCS